MNVLFKMFKIISESIFKWDFWQLLLIFLAETARFSRAGILYTLGKDNYCRSIKGHMEGGYYFDPNNFVMNFGLQFSIVPLM